MNNMNIPENDKLVKVSDEFIDIYRNFHIYNQVDRMNKLSRVELFLLLVLAIDKYDENNNIVMDNFRPFKPEIIEILAAHEGKDYTDPDLIAAGEMTGEKYVDIYQLRKENNEALPPIYTEEEAIQLRRDHSIKIIVDNK